MRIIFTFLLLALTCPLGGQTVEIELDPSIEDPDFRLVTSFEDGRWALIQNRRGWYVLGPFEGTKTDPR